MADHRYILRGEIDLAVAPQLRFELRAAIARDGADMLIDCTGLTFIDSTGIGLLLEANEALEATGRHMLIVNVAKGPRRAFEVLGLTGLLGDDGEATT
jgi:anti-sigma B factor antagonist